MVNKLPVLAAGRPAVPFCVKTESFAAKPQARPVYALLVIVAEPHLHDGRLDQHLAPGAGHDLVDEFLDLFMLFAGGAHRDDAVFRIGDHRSRFAESAASW